MAYQRMQWSPDSFDSNPLQSFQGGMNMVQQAKIRELEQEQMRAKQFLQMQEEARAQAREPLALDQLRASTEQMKNAEADRRRQMKAAAIEKAAALRKAGAHSEAAAVMQAAGLTPDGEEDVFGPAPALGQASPQGQAQGGPPITGGVDVPRQPSGGEEDAMGGRPSGTQQPPVVPPPQPEQGFAPQQSPPGMATPPAAPQGPVIGKKYRYKDENGASYTIDTSERGAFDDQQRKEAIARLDQMDPTKIDPSIANLLPTVKEGIRGGMLKPDQSFKEMMDWANQIDANKAKMANATRPRTSPFAMKPGQAADDTRADAQLAGTQLNQLLGREDYKATIQAARDSKVLLDGLQSSNPASQRRALGIWAKQASGPGAVQQSERDEFVNVIGGKGLGLEKAAMAWLDGGKVPEEQLKIFSEALKDMVIKRQMETLKGIQTDVFDSFANHPDPKMQAYAQWGADRVAKQFLPSEERAAENPLTGAKRKQDARGKTAATAAKGGKDAEAVQWAKDHPNDPMAAQILKLNGL